jgi:hypothetical protein
MFNHRNVFRLIFPIVTSLLAAFVAPAQQHPSRPQRSITKDLSQGATFRFKIAPDLPEFTFKIIPEKRENDQYGNAQSTVRDIEVVGDDTSKPPQHLTGCHLDEMEPPLADSSDWFRSDDYNFDGFQDIYLLTNWGATGNQYGCVWLFNPATKNFHYSKEFSELSRGWVDPATKTIFTFDRGGMVGMVHVALKYAVENNKPVVIWSENQDWDGDKKQFHCIVQERREKEMVTIRDEWGNNSDGESPCNPGLLFKSLPRR